MMAAHLSARALIERLGVREAQIIDVSSLRHRMRAGRVRVKLGIDPTSPRLHIGNAVALRTLALFQEAGHHAILIIGDFTGRIGDPAGQEHARRELSAAQIRVNERTYLRQIAGILNVRRTEVRHNSEWFGRMRAAEFLSLLRRVPLRSALEREEFQRRQAAGREVRLAEAMYPILQAYDSVAVRADVELGGVDQRLNLIAGRELQRAFGLVGQEIVMLPYLIGLDGTAKMSKSFGNTIELTDGPIQMFGKVMSIPDRIILNYARLAAWMSPVELAALERQLRQGANPRDVKRDVAEAMVRLYHGAARAAAARKEFLSVFSGRKLPTNAPAIKLAGRIMTPVELVMGVGAAGSKSEARRLVAGGALEIDGRVVARTAPPVALAAGSVVRIGKKRFWRIR